MFNLANFSLRDMTACGHSLRKIGSGAASMEEVATRSVRYLYDHLLGRPGRDKACVLVRFFKTHAFKDLPPSLQDVALQSLSPDYSSQWSD